MSRADHYRQPDHCGVLCLAKDSSTRGCAKRESNLRSSDQKSTTLPLHHDDYHWGAITISMVKLISHVLVSK